MCEVIGETMIKVLVYLILTIIFLYFSIEEGYRWFIDWIEDIREKYKYLNYFSYE